MLRSEQVAVRYRLRFEAPFHFGTGLRSGLIDRLVARDADGFLYVPGSSLKGALRDRCEQLARSFNLQAASPHEEAWSEVNPNVGMVGRIFGTRFYPGRLFFDDAQMIPEDRQLFETEEGTLKSTFREWQTENRTQVSLSRVTRTAQPGMLYTTEYGIKNLRFDGSIVGSLEGTPLFDNEVGSFPLVLLVAGLLSLRQIGGNKSTGAGELSCRLVDDELMIDGQPLSVASLLTELPYFALYADLRKEGEE